MSSKMVVIIIAIIIQNKLDLAISSSWKFLQQNTQQEFASFTEVVWGSQFSLYVSFDQWLVKTWSVQVMVDNFFPCWDRAQSSSGESSWLGLGVIEVEARRL